MTSTLPNDTLICEYGRITEAAILTRTWTYDRSYTNVANLLHCLSSEIERTNTRYDRVQQYSSVYSRLKDR